MRPVEVSNVFRKNLTSPAKFVVNRGGARSTKSWSIAQLLIMRFWNWKNRKILISRKTGPALHLTAYKLVIDLLSDYGFYSQCEHDKTYRTITNPHNGSFISFLPIDDPEKIKSTEWNDIWLEEATEYTWSDFLVCQTRLSGPTTKDRPNQMFLSFNPLDENGWIEQRLILSPAFKGKCELISSTYKDNPFLDEEYIQILEDLKHQDPNAHRVFALGEYALLSHIIYPPFEVVEAYPHCDDEFFGLDFGFNNPSALVQIGIKDKWNAYLKQLIYRTHLTNTQLIDLVKSVIPEKHRQLPIYADSAEPARIEEFHAAGFNIHPAEKDVKDGIDFCKRFKFHTLAENIDINKERASYKWRQDAHGNVLDEPVKFLDHSMDAVRYGLYTHNRWLLQGAGIKVTVC